MRSKIFIISGPSGAGEDSILKGLRNKIDFVKPITTTTRKIRPGEVNGKTYHFISKNEFKRKIEANEFLEYAEEDNENFYGVTKEEMERVKNIGKVVFWKIDYKGVIYAKKLFPEIIAIMIKAPKDVLRERLKGRGESEEMIESRLNYAEGWEKNSNIFDFIVENKQGKLDEAVDKIVEIVSSC